ncbi:hypothetical protein IVB18_47360 [Bradyrhizobium sp. 186]|uniref:hypothetical protein n=1 Tax=Bradyrhizobium sp. 186 TaxID=2782654 RepID=UPI0020014AE9|nr:hypothetical protein [Bradyrhizobium sp. 186]UPK35485.1 hypothetical protein IVB18_47360 [Bradyrhizobium sp. 186]
MADSSYEFLIHFFENYLPFTPTPGQVDDFKKDLSLVSPYLMEASLVEVKNGALGKTLSQGKDWRPAIFQVYNRKVAEHAQLFPVFHSFETAFRSTVAVALEEYYQIPQWWDIIYKRLRAAGDARTITQINGKKIATDASHSIGEIIFAIDGQRFQRCLVSGFSNGFQFLECCELSHVARLIEDHWFLFAPKFTRKKNKLSLVHFKAKFKVVREARNDVYHRKSVARMTGVVSHAEDLLDYLGFSLNFVCSKVADSVPQELRFAIKIRADHRIWQV